MIKPTFAKEVYQERRTRLQKTMGSGLLLFLGNGIASYNYPDNNYMYKYSLIKEWNLQMPMMYLNKKV